ncbi:hypothetical protein cyc_08731 [Cyclospora cayetanensis]|uniref:Uncharacterized protein n=1 Tax=Cyclospora cayetanensis TaxID=88456 RepID=A0A1D3D1S7_9EIME|nr:hypothetical protein cyc_08731 [Cyclospora cayetanensis]
MQQPAGASHQLHVHESHPYQELPQPLHQQHPEEQQQQQGEKRQEVQQHPEEQRQQHQHLPHIQRLQQNGLLWCHSLKRLLHLRAAFEPQLLRYFWCPLLLLQQLEQDELHSTERRGSDRGTLSAHAPSADATAPAGGSEASRSSRPSCAVAAEAAELDRFAAATSALCGSLPSKHPVGLSESSRRLLLLPVALPKQVQSLFRCVLLQVQQQGMLHQELLLAAFEGYLLHWLQRRAAAAAALSDAAAAAAHAEKAAAAAAPAARSCRQESEQPPAAAAAARGAAARRKLREVQTAAARLLSLAEAGAMQRLRRMHEQQHKDCSPTGGGEGFSREGEDRRSELAEQQHRQRLEVLQELLRPSPTLIGNLEGAGDVTGEIFLEYSLVYRFVKLVLHIACVQCASKETLKERGCSTNYLPLPAYRFSWSSPGAAASDSAAAIGISLAARLFAARSAGGEVQQRLPL